MKNFEAYTLENDRLIRERDNLLASMRLLNNLMFRADARGYDKLSSAFEYLDRQCELCINSLNTL